MSKFYCNNKCVCLVFQSVVAMCSLRVKASSLPMKFTYAYIRAGARYFRLVRPLRARKCEQARGVWGHAN